MGLFDHAAPVLSPCCRPSTSALPCPPACTSIAAISSTFIPFLVAYHSACTVYITTCHTDRPCALPQPDSSPKLPNSRHIYYTTWPQIRPWCWPVLSCYSTHLWRVPWAYLYFDCGSRCGQYVQYCHVGQVCTRSARGRVSSPARGLVVAQF